MALRGDALKEQIAERGKRLSDTTRRAPTAQKQASQYDHSLIEASVDPPVTTSPDGKITDVRFPEVVDDALATGSELDE